VLAIVVGSLGYGISIESQAVILNGIFSVLSLISGGMSLLAAKLVMRPEDSRFPHSAYRIPQAAAEGPLQKVLGRRIRRILRAAPAQVRLGSVPAGGVGGAPGRCTVS
jgi:hypothetical protein